MEKRESFSTGVVFFGVIGCWTLRAFVFLFSKAEAFFEGVRLKRLRRQGFFCETCKTFEVVIKLEDIEVTPSSISPPIGCETSYFNSLVMYVYLVTCPACGDTWLGYRNG